LTASQDVMLIGLLLVFVSQKIVHNVRYEMAEFVQQRSASCAVGRKSKTVWL